MEKMENGRLNFLDTTIVLQNGKIHLEQFRKPLSSNVMMNFKRAVAPMSYKISCLTGEIHRANNCTSTTEALSNALNNVKNIFLKNGYPLKTIEAKKMR